MRFKFLDLKTVFRRHVNNLRGYVRNLGIFADERPEKN